MKKLICLLLCGVLLLAGCRQAGEETSPTTAPTEPTVSLTARELYDKAAAQVAALEALTLDITLEREMTLGSDTFTLNQTQRLLLQNDGSLRAQVEEERYIGSYYCESSQVFLDGTLYADLLQVGSYQTPMEPEAFLSRFAPALLLDAELYTLELQTQGSLSFTAPEAAESWLGENAQLLTASGTADLDEYLGLARSSYDVTYVLGDVTFHDKYVVYYSEGPTEPITAPTGKYQAVDSIDGPRLMDEAYGWLQQLDCFTVTGTDTAYSRAGIITVTEQTQCHSWADAEGCLTDLTVLTATEYNGSRWENTERQQYADGILTTDGEQTSMTDDQALARCRALACRYLLSPGEVAEYELIREEGALRLRCLLTEDWAYEQSLLAAELLFDNKNLLDRMADGYRTEKAECYILFDPLTGLPTGLGLEYEGYHIIEGRERILTRTAEQTIVCGDSSTYEAIARN